MKYFTQFKNFLFPLSILFLLILILLNLLFGASNLSLTELINGLKDPSSMEYSILIGLRIPRIISCILVGASLSTAGLLLQSMLNNSLASPATVGINSGAGLAVVIVSSIVGANTVLGLTISTFFGAFFASMLIYLIARLTGASRNKLILAGIAISRLFAAAIDAIVYFVPSALNNRVSFQLGTFSHITNSSLMFGGIFIIIGIIMAFVLSRYLSVLSLGDDVATSLGINVKLLRFFILLDVVFLAAGSVCIAGLLSFLGLIVPHIVRRLFGVDNYKKLVYFTVIFGSNITLLCDLLARIIFIPYEIPVGIIMSFIGIPVFIYLLFAKRGGGRFVKNK